MTGSADLPPRPRTASIRPPAGAVAGTLGTQLCNSEEAS